MGFPPKTKNSTNIAPQPAPTKDIFSKGSGGIPASLKLKNAAVKPASRPAKDFVEGVLGVDTGTDKTQSYF